MIVQRRPESSIIQPGTFCNANDGWLRNALLGLTCDATSSRRHCFDQGAGMSFLQDITSHPASWHTRPDLADNDPSSSKPSVSGAGRLSWGIGLRKSIQNLGGTFFASGSTQNDLEEKHRRKLHERKQVLYLRMKDVSVSET